ncbi:FHA domain containing protein, putative [Babesia bigemina]|uniref:FHA domain containing protein, putative n=1 Tax=Babesia bigemina TaxID=5866 RepID=A0A061D8P6_BABBI|nr:FHA domain containing protein, putative [Babesia bigemina]CDR97086.1 FHA domain containing protein, putative [Babesia bigemina]|eukprot:XP_012769272.1 FHA domain containing protein, putative [Babesia bigemina]
MHKWSQLELALPTASRRGSEEGRGLADYVPPPWASFDPQEVLGKDAHALSVDVISRGTLLENVELGRSAHCVLGSMDECQLVYKNPLVSRRHLVLQLNRYGRLLLYDLGSTHGTTLNHVRIEPCRYYLLKVGDQIRIGERGSTSRTYVVCGPEEAPAAQEDATPAPKPKKIAKSWAAKDEQEIMSKVKNATAADYYDTNLYFDEWDDYFDRDQVKQESESKRKRKTHTAASLKADLSRLYQEEVDLLNRWYTIVKQAEDEGIIGASGDPAKPVSLVKNIQRKGLDGDRAKLQEQIDAVRADIDRSRKLLKLTRAE